MTTVIFVHGTGVRGGEYNQTLEIIRNNIQAQRPDIEVIPCCWGDELGARLAANGASVPRHAETLALDAVEEENGEILLWMQLYRDPLYELRLLSLRRKDETNNNPFEDTPGDRLRDRVRDIITNRELQAQLELELARAEILEIFYAATEEVQSCDAYRRVLPNVSESSFDEYCDAVARAIVAKIILICEQRERYLPILTDANLRDNIVNLLSRALKDETLGMGSGWILDRVLELVTNHVEHRRGYITNRHSLIPCDILLYQTRGAGIRRFIQRKIEEVQDDKIVLIAHSLGGIACVDLLVETQLPKVKYLFTVGSQAPFMYEINALYSLEFGQPLPPHFPQWLNIYDRRDFLSYIGGAIFNRNQTEHVIDIEVNNNQPFPRSHAAYWTNPTTWDTIIPRLP